VLQGRAVELLPEELALLEALLLAEPLPEEAVCELDECVTTLVLWSGR
jgi:hypothetical protein